MEADYRETALVLGTWRATSVHERRAQNKTPRPPRAGFQTSCPGVFPDTSVPHTQCPWLPLACPGRAGGEAGCGANFTSRLLSQQQGREVPQSSRKPGGKGDPRRTAGLLLTKNPTPAWGGWGALDQFPKPATCPERTPPRKAPAPPRALGQVMPAPVQEVQAPGYNAPGSPLLATEGPAGVSPTQLGTPKRKELHRPWSSAGADGCPVRARRLGERKPRRRGWVASVPGSGAAAAPAAPLPPLRKTSWARLLWGGPPRAARLRPPGGMERLHLPSAIARPKGWLCARTRARKKRKTPEEHASRLSSPSPKAPRPSTPL